MLNQNHGTRLQSTDALEAAEFKQPLVIAISSSAMRLVSTAPGLRSSGQGIKACFAVQTEFCVMSSRGHITQERRANTSCGKAQARMPMAYTVAYTD